MGKKTIQFFLLLAAATLATYYLPQPAATLFYVLTLIAYFRSENEAMWLVFFLTVCDGFIGFFGNYQAVLTLVPGLPEVEVAQIYIILSVVKAARKEQAYQPFYGGFMKVLLAYLVFLILEGYAIGLSPAMNIQFRVFKMLVPLALFYSIPRLFDKEEHYHDCFGYLFPLAIAALFAQVFTITTGITPSQFLGASKDFIYAVEVAEDRTYRGFFSTQTVLISYFGAFFYLAKQSKVFNKTYLYAVVAANFLSAYLSATRGWVLAFTFILLCFLGFIMKFSAKRLASLTVIGAIIVVGLFNLPVVSIQFQNAFNRLNTLESLAEGDLTAGGTLVRLNDRAPKVMKGWEKSPLMGLGFSDDFFQFNDFHVGNHNVLMHAGIVGALLMAVFFLYVNVKLFQTGQALPYSDPARNALLLFPVFFMGWFMIHSSSGQCFSYYSDPSNGMIQALFLSLGGLLYEKSLAPETIHQNVQHYETL